MENSKEEPDPLFPIRNAFYLGNYQQCVNEAQKLRIFNSPQQSVFKDCFLYRAYIALNKFTIPIQEIGSDARPELKIIRLLADYLADPEKRANIVEELNEKCNTGTDLTDTFFISAAVIFMHEQNFDTALRLLHQSDDLEACSLTIQCLLKMDRVDLAMKEMKNMQELDEDATITQLSLAWVNMAFGKDKLQDAFYILQEMVDKHGETPLLLVSQASCLIQQQKYDEAEKLLNEALQRDANNAEALVNMIVISQYTGKTSEITSRYINQMKQGHPEHPWTMDLHTKERVFDRIILETAA